MVLAWRMKVFLLLLFFLGGVVRAQTFSEGMVLATHKLFNEKSTATGFVLEAEDGRRFLVTAAHVFEKMEGEAAVLVSRTQDAGADGQFQRKDVKIAVRDGEKPLWVKHPTQDVAAMELKVPEGSGVRPLPIAILAEDTAAAAAGFTVGVEVWVLGYPTRFEVNEIGFPVCRRGCVASYPVVPIGKHPTMIIDYSTFEGDSGGPVFIRRHGEDRKPMLVGLVVSQFRHTENLETFTGKQTINHPLGLATVAQAGVIRETLELAMGDAETGKKKAEKEGE